MAWNRSGYHDRLSKQQMVIVDKANKAQQAHVKSSEKKELIRVQNKIIELLQGEGIAMTQVEIAEKIGERDLSVLKALNDIDKNVVQMVVAPIDETGNSTRWKIVKTSRQ
ncbi:hypothetical protein [Paenibacillus amylolyticus]|uniref:hypothetical protein n=1 Tax=Paenibacillus amylolyticus TaxID=1451 RepID=UPI003D9760CC